MPFLVNINVCEFGIFFRYEDDDRRFYWSGRHGPHETEREGRQSVISRNLDSDRRVEDWNEEARHRRRRETRDRRCCPDWEQAEHGKIFVLS